MAGPGNPVLSWDQLHKGAAVRFYTSSAWKKGIIANTDSDSCSVAWELGSVNHVTRVWDVRNIRIAGDAPG